MHQLASIQCDFVKFCTPRFFFISGLHTFPFGLHNIMLVGLFALK